MVVYVPKLLNWKDQTAIRRFTGAQEKESEKYMLFLEESRLGTWKNKKEDETTTTKKNKKKPRKRKSQSSSPEEERAIYQLRECEEMDVGCNISTDVSLLMQW